MECKERLQPYCGQRQAWCYTCENYSAKGQLLSHLDRLHTTALGVERIRRNLAVSSDTDVVAWCKKQIAKNGSTIIRRGKNWYADVDNCEITVNAHSYTIITAKRTKIKIRAYQPVDNEQLTALFFDTVHAVTVGDYTAAQRDVWAPVGIDAEKWCKPFCKDYVLVAVKNGEIVGFATLTETGCLDRLYVHKDHQRQGIATLLSEKIESHAQKNNIQELSADVSITAKPFFIKQGYQLLCENIVERDGERLRNYKMKKHFNK